MQSIIETYKPPLLLGAKKKKGKSILIGTRQYSAMCLKLMKQNRRERKELKIFLSLVFTNKNAEKGCQEVAGSQERGKKQDFFFYLLKIAATLQV